MSLESMGYDVDKKRIGLELRESECWDVFWAGRNYEYPVERKERRWKYWKKVGDEGRQKRRIINRLTIHYWKMVR